MSGIKHIVNRVAVNTSGIATENVFQWRASLASYISDVFPRQLQQILDELFLPEEQVIIERLDVNIDLAKAQVTEQLQRELMQALRKAISHQKQEAILMKLQNAALPVPGILNRSLDAWFFYLQKGYYPWFHQQVLTGRALESLIEEQAPNIIQRLPELLNSFQAQQRFLIEISGRMLLVLLPYFVITNNPSGLFEKSTSIGQGREKQAEKARQILLGLILNKEQIEADRFIQMMHPAFHLKMQHLRERRKEPGEKMNHSIKRKSNHQEEEKDAAVWIQNAGLILLHPFLPVLFERVSIVNDQKQLTDIGKALALLHYLLYEEEEYSDALMVLPKIICGKPYNDPVRLEAAINSEEKKECDELLLSVIEYWDALKSTSVKGLLQSFVWRKGKLTYSDSGWLLRVENRAEDILLDRLPWSIGYIKLPWMTTPLTTEWR